MYSFGRIRLALALERNVLVLSGTVFLLVTSLFTWYLLLPLYLRDLGASDSQVGLAYSLLTAAFFLMQFAGGLLADRYGRKLLIVLPTFIFMPLYALAGAARTWLALLAVLFIINSLSAIQVPAFMSLIAESVPEERRGVAFGVFNAAIGLASAIGPSLGAAILPSAGIKPLIYSTAMVTLFCAMARTAFLRETSYQPSPAKMGDLKRLLDAELMWLLIAACLFASVRNLTLWGPFLSLHAGDVLHLNKPQINLLFAIGGFAAMITSLPGGRLADRYGSGNTLMIGCLAHVLTTLAWALSQGPWVGVTLFIAANLALQAATIAYNTLLTQVTSQNARGAIIGLFGTVTGIVGGAAPAMGAYVRGNLGSTAPFWGALGVGLVMALSLRKVNAIRHSPFATRSIYSIGHSTRSLDELVALLKAHAVVALVDVRRFPRSRRNPQFNKETVEEQLPRQGIEYHWLGELLGGFRGGGFQGYAAYMETEDFERGLGQLEGIAAGKRTAFMCAEKLYFRCHRSRIADALVGRGWQVHHVVEAGRKPYEHKTSPNR